MCNSLNASHFTFGAALLLLPTKDVNNSSGGLVKFSGLLPHISEFRTALIARACSEPEGQLKYMVFPPFPVFLSLVGVRAVMGPGLPYHVAMLLKHLVSSCRI